MNTNDEIIKVVQSETEGKTILVKALFITGVSHITPSDIQWHEKSADKPWDFTNRAYKVKPVSVEDFVQSMIGDIKGDHFHNGYYQACENILKFIKENK